MFRGWVILEGSRFVFRLRKVFCVFFVSGRFV